MQVPVQHPPAHEAARGLHTPLLFGKGSAGPRLMELPLRLRPTPLPFHSSQIASIKSNSGI